MLLDTTFPLTSPVVNAAKHLADTLYLSNDSLIFLVKNLTEKQTALEKALPNLIAIGVPIIVAVLGGWWALKQVKLNIQLTDDNKWIETIRSDISSYCKLISDFALIKQNSIDLKKRKSEKKIKDETFVQLADRYYERFTSVSSELRGVILKIHLHLDSSNEKHRNLIKRIKGLFDYVNSTSDNFDYDYIPIASQWPILLSNDIFADKKKIKNKYFNDDFEELTKFELQYFNGKKNNNNRQN
jgi:hypothetical protein